VVLLDVGEEVAARHEFEYEMGATDVGLRRRLVDNVEDGVHVGVVEGNENLDLSERLGQAAACRRLQTLACDLQPRGPLVSG
jgi:hypothetical protein